VEIQENYTLDLRTLVNLSPADANINGVPITANDLVWSIQGNNSTGSSVSGSTFTAGTVGQAVIQAVLPASMSSTGSAIQAAQTITIVALPPSFIPVGSISMTNTSPLQVDFYTQTVNNAKSVYNSGKLYLSPYAAISPANASVKSPIEWSAVSGSTGAVTIDNSSSEGILQVKTSLTGAQIPADRSKVAVKAAIPNGGGAGVNASSLPVEITLVEHHSIPVQPGGLSLQIPGPAIQIGDTFNLNTLVTLQAGAMYDNVPLTAVDLNWSIVSGASYGSLSGAALTGTGAGIVKVKAVLPAIKNLGTERTAETTILVVSPPPPNPSVFTLRIIKVPKIGDGVIQVVLVPVTGDTYSQTVYETGYTGVKWATYTGSYHGTHLDEFKKLYPPSSGATYYTVSKFDSQGTGAEIKRENEWADIDVPWPTGNVTGYHVFFIEADKRVRSYCTLKSAKTDDVLDATGDPDRNFLFFIRPDYLYANRLLPMGITKSDGYKEVDPAATASVRQVIPISYTDWENVPSIMTSNGVGNRPKTNYGTIMN
jgi:hypothetical protein